jgi:hypothetical protein
VIFLADALSSGSTPVLVSLIAFVGIVVAAVVGPALATRRAKRDRIEERAQERAEREAEREADKQRARDERLQDLEAQDAVRKEALRQQQEVAATLEDAAVLLRADQEKTRKAAEEVARRAEAADVATRTELGEIKGLATDTHILVNSNMDEQKRIALRLAEEGLESRQREVVGLREIVSLRKALGQEATPDALAAIEAAETAIEKQKREIVDLRQELEERAKRLEIVEKAAAPPKGGA